MGQLNQMDSIPAAGNQGLGGLGWAVFLVLNG
jgi:hypothetical protein